MPLLANVALIDTFDTWRTVTNQIVTVLNGNTVNFTSNNSSLFVSPNVSSQGTVFLEVRTSSSMTDSSTVNVASMRAVNTLSNLSVTIFNYANTAANNANANTVAAFNYANTLNTFVYGVSSNTKAAFDKANSGGAILVTDTAPVAQSAGTLWWNSEYGRLLILYDDGDTIQWVDASPANDLKDVYNTSNAAFAIGNTGNNVAVSAFIRANAANSLAANALPITGGTITGNVTFSNVSFSGSTINVSSNILSQTLTDGATINWNLSQGQVAYVTLGGNRTIAAPTNLRVGSYVLHVIQDGSGNRTLTWNSVFKWPGGVAPTLTTTASRRDLFSFICDGTNLYGSFLPDVR